MSVPASSPNTRPPRVPKAYSSPTREAKVAFQRLACWTRLQLAVEPSSQLEPANGGLYALWVSPHGTAQAAITGRGAVVVIEGHRERPSGLITPERRDDLTTKEDVRTALRHFLAPDRLA